MEDKMKIASRIMFIVMAAIILLASISVVGGLPFGDGKVFAPLKKLCLGRDFGGEATLIIGAKEEHTFTAEEQNMIIDVLKNRMAFLGFRDCSIGTTENGEFVVSFAMNETSEFNDPAQIGSSLTETGDVKVRDSKDTSKIYITRDMIKEAMIQTTSLGVNTIFFMFTDEGKASFEESTTEISNREKADDKYVEILYDGQQLSKQPIRNPVTEGYIGFNSAFSDKEADYFKNIINSGYLPLEMEVKASEKLSPVMGKGSFNTVLIAVLAVIGAFYIADLFRNKLLAVSDLLMVFGFISLYVIVMALLGIEITMATVATFLAVLAGSMAALLVINENMKKEYVPGVSLGTVLSKGHSSSMGIIGLIYGVLGALFGAFLVSGNHYLEKVSYSMGISLVLSALFVLLINRLMQGMLFSGTETPRAFFTPWFRKGEAK